MDTKLPFRIRLSNWLFKRLFPAQADHMGHLVDDVIQLERESKEYRRLLKPAKLVAAVDFGYTAADCGNRTYRIQSETR